MPEKPEKIDSISEFDVVEAIIKAAKTHGIEISENLKVALNTLVCCYEQDCDATNVINIVRNSGLLEKLENASLHDEAYQLKQLLGLPEDGIQEEELEG